MSNHNIRPERNSSADTVARPFKELMLNVARQVASVVDNVGLAYGNDRISFRRWFFTNEAVTEDWYELRSRCQTGVRESDRFVNV